MSNSQRITEFGRVHSAEEWVLYGGVLVIFLLFVWSVYRKDAAEHSGPIRYLLTGLRWSVYGVLLWIFLDYHERTETERMKPSRVLVLADTSLSMTITDEARSDAQEPKTREARMLEVFSESSLLTELRRTHEVAVYRFGEELEKIAFLPKEETGPANPNSEELSSNDPAESASPSEPAIDWSGVLEARGARTRLGDALADALRRESGTPLSGILLFTDGRSNAGAPIEPAVELAKLGKVPVHAVGLGSDRQSINLRIVDLEVPTRVFRSNDELKVTAFVQGLRMAGRNVEIEFLERPADAEEAPTLLESQSVQISEDSSPVAVDFSYEPKKSGHWQLIVRGPTDADELRTDDNVATVGLEVVERKTKVLLWSGGPGREYRFLRTLLFRDSSTELSVLLQTAGESLSQDADHLLRIFPEDSAELFEYDVLVAIDPDWTVLKPQTRQLLSKWVSDQAGGLLVLAGPIHTPRLARSERIDKIAELYPVVLKEVFSSELDRGGLTEPWPLEFTSEGLAADFLRLEDDPAASQLRWREFSGFFFAYPIVSLKPGASVLAKFSDPRARTSNLAPPVFASQFYGSGRVFYVCSAEMWRLRRLGEKYYDRFWIRLIRHLGQGRMLRGASRGTLLLEAERYPLGTSVPIRARLLDEEFEPLVAIKVLLSVTDPANQVSQLEMQPQVGQSGWFVAALPARLSGEYRLQLLIPSSSEVIERRIRIEVPRAEFDDPRLDRDLLTHLTSRTGGKLLDITQVEEIPSLLEDRTEIVVLSDTPPVPLWDKTWVMLLVAGLLSLEWLIRKLLTLA